MAENRVVPEALDHENYNIWSNCMKVYLLSRDLWDVLESEPQKSSKKWRRRNALALHAIHMSCGADRLLEIGELDSAREAWEALMTSVNISGNETVAEEQMETIGKDGIDYDEFVKASLKGDWRAMKKFLDSHPGANISTVVGGRTALHYVLRTDKMDTFESLAKEVTDAKDFEIQNDEGYTIFASLANRNQPGVLKMLQYLFSRNSKLPDIGDSHTLPLAMAAWKGFKETTRYLYDVTDKQVLNPDLDNDIGVEVLFNCINNKLFDIASKIVTDFPEILQRGTKGSKDEKMIYPIHALAKSLSALESGTRHKKARAFRVNHWLSKSWKYLEHVKRLLGEEEMFEGWDDDNKLVHDQAQEFIGLVCKEVSSFDPFVLKECVYDAMIEATRNGLIEFVRGMLKANPILIQAYDNKRLFAHAVESRQEKVFSLIYSFMDRRESLFSMESPEKNNILHMVAELPPSAVLDRSSGPALQMQRELQWFKGTPMWCQVKASMVRRFRPLLPPGYVLSIKDFRVFTVTTQYRPVDTKFGIAFTMSTKVERIENPAPSIPMHGFQFATHATIMERTGSATYLTDVIGCIVSVGDLEVVTGNHKKRDVELLCESSGKIKITLWKEHAETFITSHNIRTATSLVIVIFTSMTVKQYVDALNFSSSGSTMIYVGLDHPKVNALRSHYASDARPILFLGRSPGVSGTTEEAMTENRMPISDILDAVWADEKPGYKITFAGRISEISTKYGWYYYGCSECKKKVVITDGTYKCDNDNCPSASGPPAILFKINFTVTDKREIISCTAMNNVAERMVDSSAMKFFNRAGVGDHTFPRQILDLVGKEYIFKIALGDYNLYTGGDVLFTVVDVYTLETEDQPTGSSAGGSSYPIRTPRRSRSSNVNASSSHSEVDVTPQKRLRFEDDGSGDEDA